MMTQTSLRSRLMRPISLRPNFSRALRSQGILWQELFSSLKVVFGLALIIWMFFIGVLLLGVGHTSLYMVFDIFMDFHRHGIYGSDLLLLLFILTFLLGVISSTEDEENSYRSILLLLPISPFGILLRKAGAHIFCLFLFMLLIQPFLPSGIPFTSSAGERWAATSVATSLWIGRLPIIPIVAFPVMFATVWIISIWSGAVIKTLAGAALGGCILVLGLLGGTSLLTTRIVGTMPRVLYSTALYSSILVLASTGLLILWRLKYRTLEPASMLRLLPRLNVYRPTLIVGESHITSRFPNPLLLPFCLAPLIYVGWVNAIRFCFLDDAEATSLFGSFRFYVAAALTGAILGTYCWFSNERDAATSPLYVLPVGRSQVLSRRLIALFTYSLIFGVPIGVYLRFSFTDQMIAQHLDGPSLQIWNSDQRFIWATVNFNAQVLPCWIPFVLLGSAVTASLFALFFRSRLLAIIISGILWSIWSAIGVLVLWLTCSTQTNLMQIDMSQAIWGSLALTLLTIVPLWLAYCRSRLLEQSDSRRAMLGLIAAPVLAAWGCFFLTGNPVQLVHSIRPETSVAVGNRPAPIQEKVR